MATPSNLSLSRFRGSSLTRILRATALAFGVISSLLAAEPAPKSFDVPADAADKSLKRFSEQAGLEFVFPSELTRGVRTQPVKGTMTAREALDTMLAKTGLAAIRDEQTGAFTLSRNAAPNAPRAAQTTPSDRPLPVPAPAPETVELSPFEVRSDYAIGYRSLESISGSNSRIAIRDLPQSISVFNSEFISDIGASNLAESVAYSASLTSGRNVQQFNRVEFSLRGFPATTLREGLNWGLGNDGYNVDRIEVVKGPSAVLYGASQPGGFVNVMAKRPRNKYGGSAKLTLGSYERRRAEIDVTGPLAQNGALLFRFMGAYEKFDTFRDWENGENTYLNPVVTWKPLKRASFTVSYEYQNSHRTPNNQTPILYPSSAGPAALTNAANPPSA